MLRKTFAFILFSALCCSADPLDTLRLKWRAILAPERIDETIPEIREQLSAMEERARRTWKSMNAASDSDALWPELSSTTSSSQITAGWSRLRSMALAWATPGQKLYGDPELLAAVRKGMSWMEQHRYNPRVQQEYANWWDWEIGCPLALDDLLVLLYDRLTPEEITKYAAAIDRFVPDPRFLHGHTPTTGANRVWKCQGAILRAIVIKDQGKLQSATDALAPVFPYVTSGDGFYEDGSFIQHSRHPYTGGYGNALLFDLSDLLYLVAGSEWDVRDPARDNIYRWVFESFEPILYRGAMMDMVRGREVSRSSSTDHATGHSVAASILRVSQFAPSQQAQRMRSLVKEQLLSDTAMSNFAGRSIEQIMAIHALLADNSVPRRGDLRGGWIFAGMDRAVHQRANWAFGIAIDSSRIFNFESINGENLHNWHAGDGMTYLYTADLAQFSDGFWPTVDPQRLPGITVVAGSIEHPNRTGRSPIAGGASVDGKSSVMMQLAPDGVSLEAKKSWFLLDDEVVAVGSGIRSEADAPVETIIENRMLRGSSSFAQGQNGKWAFLDGTAGYYFPDGAGWKTAEIERQGSWKDITEGGSTASLERRYRTIWFDHGAKPDGAKYAYAILPATTRAKMEAYAAAPGLQIVENSENAHAISVQKTGIRAVNFWKDESHVSNGITCDRIASVILHEGAGMLTIGVADATQLNTGSIHLTFDRSASRVIEKDPSITIEGLSPSLRIVIDVKNSQGRTFKVKLGLPGH
jgi:hyaluronate lyase